MPLGIGQRPGHSFNEPLGLLSDCHRRIEHFLRMLIAIDADASGGPLTPSQREALTGALQYFAIAAPKHTADEEDSLFPRLRDSNDPDVRQALMLVARLEHDHEEADEHHAAIDALARRWLTNDALATGEAAELRDRLTRVRNLYQQHIALEDQTLFPAAARVLDAAQLDEIGREMAARRQISADTITAIQSLVSPMSD
jgi:hemerythrin-like domain-containing protein